MRHAGLIVAECARRRVVELRRVLRASGFAVTTRRLRVIAPVAFALVAVAASSALAQPPAPQYRTFRPERGGPHPAIVFVSGCDGFTPSIAPNLYDRRAEAFRGQGYVVVFADYLGRRGLKTCAGPISHSDAARDVVAAAAWLASQREVDASRITAMGWSYGARLVLVALAEHAERSLGFSRAVVYYPDCRALRPWTAAPPVLMLLGGDDDMTPARLCQEAVTRVAAPATVKVVVYPGALHGFDISELPARTRYGFGSLGYHREAAASAQAAVEQFLRR
jgi:dienelactone hydrolase